MQRSGSPISSQITLTWACVARVRTLLVERGQQRRGLLGRRARMIDVAKLRCRPRLRHEREAQGLRIGTQPGGLDGRLGGVERLAQLNRDARAPAPARPSSRRRTARGPAPRANADPAAEVTGRIGVALAEVLGEAEVVRAGRAAERAVRPAVRRVRRRSRCGPTQPCPTPPTAYSAKLTSASATARRARIAGAPRRRAAVAAHRCIATKSLSKSASAASSTCSAALPAGPASPPSSASA